MFILIDEKYLAKQHEKSYRAWRVWMKRNFEHLLEELEDDYLENPSADNEDVYLDVKWFVDDFDNATDEHVCMMRDDYRLYARKYGLRFY